MDEGTIALAGESVVIGGAVSDGPEFVGFVSVGSVVTVSGRAADASAIVCCSLIGSKISYIRP